MKVIYRPREAGKTTELIKLAAADEKGDCKYIVCATQADCTRIAEQAKEMGVNIWYPITFLEFLSGLYYGRNIKSFLIDDVDRLLLRLSRVPIEAITLTKDGST